jgi:hypothetical protein
MNLFLFLERVRAKHLCRQCGSGMRKGEPRLVEVVRTSSIRHEMYFKYCLMCAKKLIQEHEQDLRYDEYASLLRSVEKLLEAERHWYVAKEIER